MSGEPVWPEPFFAELAAAFGSRPRRNEPLARHTTSRLGGPADVWLAVTSVDELVAAVLPARRYGVPVFVLGSGANLLIRDSGIRGLVIGNRAGGVRFPPSAAEGTDVILAAESGAVLPNLARRCAGRGLSGLEWAVGVPGTIGGAVTNNAGAYGGDIAGMLARAELLSPDGARLWQPAGWFQYDYRTSRLKRQPDAGWIVLQAELRLQVAQAAEIRATTDDFNARRKRSQPPGATMGSMFKNPPGDFAGRLIEAAGLKGHTVGQARISPRHANFFENLGGATAAQMIQLIETAQAAVAAQFGVALELEIEVIGE